MQHMIDSFDLRLLIEALDEKVFLLETELKKTDEDEGVYADIELELMHFTNLAARLEKMYIRARTEVGNLPPYEKLLKKRTN